VSRYALLWLLICFVACPCILHAAPLAEAQAILKEGWGGTPEALQDVERRYELLAARSAPDADIAYALALVRLKYHKYDTAVDALESATASRAGHLAAWRAKFWLLVFLRKHDAAIAQMQALANIFPAGAKAPAVETELVETARWMGRLHGHLTWAAAETPPAMEQHTGRLAAKLAGERLAAFEEGRKEVRDACEKLQLEFGKIQTQDAADEAKRRELATTSNQKERERITAERAALDAETTAAKTKFDAAMAEFQAQLAPLEKDYSELQLKAKPILNRVGDLKQQADRKDRDAKNERDNNRKKDLQRDADRLNDQARDEQRRLDPIQRDADKVEREASKIQTERTKLAAAGQAYTVTVNQKHAALARDEKTVERSEKALLAPAKPTPRQTSLQSRIAAISTYQRFPIEEERTRLLELVK
jgi:hypothetical protein